MSTLCPTFVRVKMRVCLSDGSVKTITFWGQKLGPRHYRKVNVKATAGFHVCMVPGPSMRKGKKSHHL